MQDPMLEFIIDKLNNALLNDDDDEFEKYLDVLIEGYPEFAEEYLGNLRIINDNIENNINKIEEELNGILKNNPKTSEEYCENGTILLLQTKFEEALECFNKAIELDNDNTLALTRKSILLELLNKNDELKDLHEAIMNSKPKNISDFRVKASYLNQYDEFEECDKCCDEGLKLDKNDSDLNFFKGLCLSTFSEFEDAIKHFNIAIDNFDDESFGLENFYYEKGICQYHLNKLDEALKDFNESLKIDSYFLKAHYGIAVVLEEKGEYEKALKEINLCLEEADEYPQINKLKEILEEKLKID